MRVHSSRGVHNSHRQHQESLRRQRAQLSVCLRSIDPSFQSEKQCLKTVNFIMRLPLVYFLLCKVSLQDVGDHTVHSFLSIVALSNVYLFAISYSQSRHPFTKTNQVGGPLLSPILFVFNMFCECLIFQTLFLHYILEIRAVSGQF